MVILMEEYARRGKRVILSGGAARFGPPAAITAMACRTEVAGKGPGANAYWIDARALSLSAGGGGELPAEMPARWRRREVR